jgi:hypothetical protein
VTSLQHLSVSAQLGGGERKIKNIIVRERWEDDIIYSHDTNAIWI